MGKYQVEDTITGKKYIFEGDSAPTENDIQDNLYGTITASKPNAYREAQRNLLGEDTAKLYQGEEIPLALQSGYNWISRQTDRLAGALRAVANVSNPIDGFINPEKYPTTNASKAWNITDPVQSKVVDFLADTALNLGAFHLAYNVLPTLASIPYTKAQGKEIDAFKKVLANEFKVAGMGEVAAAQSAEVTTQSIMEQTPFLRKTPWAIKESTDALKANEGRLGQMIKDYAFNTKKNAVELGYDEWMQRATKETARLNQWLQDKEPTQRPNLNVPLHPAPATSIDMTKPVSLTYPGVPKVVSRNLPTEVVAPPTQDEVVKTLSRFPQKVTDQKSLEEVGNAMAKEMGIVKPIDWKFKPYDKSYVTGQAITRESSSEPHEILIRVPKDKLGRVDTMKLLESNTPIKGSRGGELLSTLQPTQGKIKKIILHELTHLTNPVGSHTSIFWDDVKYHEANTLIQRELRQKAVAGQQGLPLAQSVGSSPSVSIKNPETVGQSLGQPGEQPVGQPLVKTPTPTFQTEHYAAYSHPEGTQVVNSFGEEINVFEDDKAAQRWVTRAEKDFTKNQKAVSNSMQQPKIAIDTLLDNPDLADAVVADPSKHDPVVVDLARQIVASDQDIKVTPQMLVDNPDMADLVVSKPGNQLPEVVTEAEKIQTIPTPQLSMPEDIVTGDFNTDSYYAVTLSTPSGARTTTLKGSQLNFLNNELKANKIPVYNGNQIIKITNAFPLSGDSGQVNLEALNEVITNMHGLGVEARFKFLNLSKKFGTPFFIAQKYPAFKPIYMGISDGIDVGREKFSDLMVTFDYDLQTKKLGDASKAKILGVLKIGSTLGRSYDDATLMNEFKLNEQEIQSYKGFRAAYDAGLKLEISKRKIGMGYYNATPQEKVAIDKAVEEQTSKRRGYVNQQRIFGKWAVFAPADKVGDVPKFFNLYTNEYEAKKAVELLGGDAHYYFRQKALNIYSQLTMPQLEALVSAAEVDNNSVEVQALFSELRKRSFASHWIERQNVPGYEWNWENVVNSAIEYFEGVSGGYGKTIGKTLAMDAFHQGIKNMPKEIAGYSKEYIDAYFNTGQIGWSAVNKAAYLYGLAFKPSFFIQNILQPLQTTLPELGKYYPNINPEKIFLSNYSKSAQYIMHRFFGKAHGINDPELVSALDKAHRQGVLGDQMSKFLFEVKSNKMPSFSKMATTFARSSEAINRTHAFICGYNIAVNKLGLTDPNAIFNFAKEFVSTTQFAYGKQNIPTLITEAGALKNLMRTAYTFRHFQLSYMQYMGRATPWRGAKMGQFTRAWGILMAMVGIGGISTSLGVDWAYKSIFGRTLKSDLRLALAEANIPGKAVDMALYGIPAFTGIDASMMLGLGDVYREDKSLASNIGGFAAGQAENIASGIQYFLNGDYTRAFEKISPSELRNLIRATRYAREGLRKSNGELLGTPSGYDAALASLGFAPLNVSKMYEQQEAKVTIEDRRIQITSHFNNELAKAMYSRDFEKTKRIYQKIREHNARVPIEFKVNISSGTIFNRIKEMKGISSDPLMLRKKFRELDTVYGGRR